MTQVRLCWSQKLTTLCLSKLAAHLEHPTGLQSALELGFEVMKSSFPVSEKLLLRSSLSSIALIHFFAKKTQYKSKVISLHLFSNVEFLWVFLVAVLLAWQRGSCASLENKKALSYQCCYK